MFHKLWGLSFQPERMVIWTKIYQYFGLFSKWDTSEKQKQKTMKLI